MRNRSENMERLRTLTERLADTHRPARILLVEDDDDVGRVLLGFFEVLAPQAVVSWAKTCEEALGLAGPPVPFDLAWLDIVLPSREGSANASGLRVARKLREGSPTLPIVVCSGYYDPDAIDAMLSAVGVLTIFRKPISIEEIRGVLRATGILGRILCPDCPRLSLKPTRGGLCDA